MRQITSFTIEPDALEYVRRTRRGRSRSERVNQLLRRAIQQERYDALAAEAAAFFATASGPERRENRAWQARARKSLARD